MLSLWVPYNTQQPLSILWHSENLRLGIEWYSKKFPKSEQSKNQECKISCRELSMRSEGIYKIREHTPKSEGNRDIDTKTAIK